MATEESDTPILYGFDTSTYTQIVRMVLTEKGVPYDYVATASWAGETKNCNYRDLNPFALVPVLDHRRLRLFETLSITHYVDAAFDGRGLLPADAEDLARMYQLIAIHDHHVRKPWVTTISAIRSFSRFLDRSPDEGEIARALPAAERAADILGDLLSERNEAQVDLADLWLAPATHFFNCTPEGASIIGDRPALGAWWQRMQM